MLTLAPVLGTLASLVEICTSGTVAAIAVVLLGIFGRSLLTQIRRIARHEPAPSFAARWPHFSIVLASITIFGATTSGVFVVVEPALAQFADRDSLEAERRRRATLELGIDLGGYAPRDVALGSGPRLAAAALLEIGRIPNPAAAMRADASHTKGSGR